MRDFYKIVDKLIEKQIYVFFQSQDRSRYFILEVKDNHGEMQYFKSESFDSIEKSLKMVWGHLLEAPAVKVLPTPFGFPSPV